MLLIPLTLALALLGAIGTTPAYAATGPAIVTVTLDALEPALPQRDGMITVRGTARNLSDLPISAAQVVLWRHGPVLQTTGDLREVVAQPPEFVGGFQAWTDGAYQRLTTPGEPAWAPGDTRTFEIAAPVSELGFPAAAGAYLIGAQVVGRPGQQPLGTLGEARVLIPLDTSGSASIEGTNTIVSAVELSSRPSMIEPGVFVDDHLAAEIASDGRLTRLLRAAERGDVAWLVDPALLEELLSMADGYRVQTSNGDAPGTAQEAATAWLAEFGQLDRTRGYRLPFAVPDASMLERHELTRVMDRAAAAGGRVTEVADLPLISYAADGRFSPGGTRLAAVGDPVAVLSSSPVAQDALLEPPASRPAGPGATGAAPIVNFSPATTAGGPAPEPSDSFVQIRQRMLTESFLTARTDPGATTVRVLTTGDAARADELVAPSWTRRRELGDLLRQQPAAWGRELDYGLADRAAELDPGRVATLRGLATSFAAYADLLAEPGTAARATDAALSRSASSWWRGDGAGFDRYASPQVARADRLSSERATELTVQRSVIMSGQSGSFPVTVRNNLDESLRVALTFESFQPQRLSIPDIPDVVVPANESVTVNVQPRAVGNGPVRISSQVMAPNGQPISRRVWLTVEATNFGRVGWFIVAASGIVLLATTAWRIGQVRRERRRVTAAAAAEAPVHPTPPVVMIDSAHRGGER